MEQVLITEQILLPITNTHSAESARSNYANYMSASTTNDVGALIDIIEDILITVGPTDNSNM